MPGDKITGTFHVLHRSSFYGPDADDFRPERWETIRPTWEFLPFSGGPRACPGQMLATTQAAFVLLGLSRLYERCESRDERPWTEELKMTAVNGNGCLVGFMGAKTTTTTTTKGVAKTKRGR